MGFGIFGKLPQKRDFVTYGVPQKVLHPFETWLQSAVAASRNDLGRGWEERYLVAPLWRFWIGPGVFGQTCTGTIMPSVDQVGRFFPFLIIYCGEEGAVDAPPPFSPRNDWYAQMEARSLAILDDSLTIDVQTLVSDLEPMPAGGAQPEPLPALFKQDPVWQLEREGVDSAAAFRSIVEADYWRVAETRSYWWQAGGEGGPLTVHAAEGMPDPYFFTLMVGGSGPQE